ncbi:hypothetical protein GS497_26490, partial [Rhodococcus hoagii]|nr:hypothetical protein [Prescottella equi]
WSDLLGAPDLGRDDDFFDVGGNSLLATQVAGRLTSTTGVEIGVRDVFDARHRRGPGDGRSRPGCTACGQLRTAREHNAARRRSALSGPAPAVGSSISLIPRPTCTTWPSRCASRVTW